MIFKQGTVLLERCLSDSSNPTTLLLDITIVENADQAKPNTSDLIDINK